MSAETFTPVPVTAPAPGLRPVTGARRGRRLGDGLRAVKVFAAAAVSVVILGECDDEEAGVRRHR
ncbi:hypothetical protein ACX6XY_06955 [Streptomyces sp. O3]